MDTKTRISVFQNPSRDVRGQLETRRHRDHGVGSLESIAASPSVALHLCVSVSLCFKIRPGMCADSWKHGGTEFTESAAWNLFQPPPLCLCISVFQNPSRECADSWKHGGTEITE